MGDEPGGVDGLPVEWPAVGLLEDLEQLGEDPGHLVGEGQIAGGEAGVDQVQGDRHGLCLRQRLLETGVDVVEDPLGGPQLIGVEVGDLCPQGVLDVDALPQAFDREAQVVGQAHHRGGAQRGAHLSPGGFQGLVRQQQVLRRDGSHQGSEIVRVAPVVGDEDANHLGLVDPLPGLGLETEAAAGEDHLASGRIAGEDDVVVEDAQHLHAVLLPVDSSGVGSPKRWWGHSRAPTTVCHSTAPTAGILRWWR